MIKLTTLLKEFEFGKQLFTDPKASDTVTPDQYKKFLDKYHANIEPNSQDETKFLKKLQRYFEDNTKDIDVNVLKELLALKSRFPFVLDPKTSRYKSAYRGTVIPIEDLLKMDLNWYNSDAYQAKNSSYTYISKGNAGFLSFSNAFQQAELFSIRKKNVSKNFELLVTSNVFPAVLEIEASNPNLLFNTEFTNLISPYFNEEEFIYVGNSVKPKTILISKTKNIFREFKDLEKEWPMGYKLQLKLEDASNQESVIHM
jgi:hypothetical protein